MHAPWKSTRACLAVSLLTAAGLAVLGDESEDYRGEVRDGRVGKALDLGGRCGIELRGPGDLRNLTLALWIRAGEPPEGESSVFSTNRWERGALHFLWAEGPGLLVATNGNDPEEHLIRLDLEGRLQMWNHIALAYSADEKTSRVFLNGRRVGEILYDEAGPLDLGEGRVGAWDLEPRCFRGLVDDFRIYTRALSDVAVAKIAGGVGPQNGLAVWWKLDEKDDYRVEDASGNGRHGRILAVEPEEEEEEEGPRRRRSDTPLHLVKVTGEERLASGIESLSRAAEYLSERYPEYRSKATRHLGRAQELKAQLEEALGERTSEKRKPLLAVLRESLDRAQQEALVADNPLMRFDRLLFVRRYTYQSSHFYTDFIDGCEHFGGNLCILSLKDGSVAELVPSLSGGIFGRFDLSFDAQRVVFDYKRKLGEGFRIWEVGIDGEGLRQLTFEPPDEAERIRKYDNSHLGGTGRMYPHHTDDMQPCYLPDGGICFTSSRCEYGTLCDAPDILSTTVLYRMDADGTHMERLTNSSVSEFSPAVLPDGRVLYSRWEYVDKGQIGVKCLWAMRPDGTGTVEIFGNNHPFPPTLIHGRPIPGSDGQFVVLGTPHFPQSGVGTVIRIDTTHPVRTRAPMTYITPDVDIRTEGGFHHRVGDGWVRNDFGPLYMDPYPLDEKQFLVSHNPDRRWNDVRAYGLYLLDEFGNHVLVYQDPEYSAWQPVPLRPRERPTVLPTLASTGDEQDGGSEVATVVMTDVYEGLTGVERGTIRYLRIMEQVPRPWACRRFWDEEGRYGHHSLLSAGSVLGLKVLHGLVPVHEDGSAYFTVPTNTNIYFQALDEDFLEVQRMRTYVNFRPGETRSCIGCHEPRRLAPMYKPALALRHPPAKPSPQPGETAPRPVHYVTDVQPVLDKHCVRCHGGRDPDDDLDLSGEMTEFFVRSYESIFERRLVRTFNEGSDFGGTAATPPRTIGSHASRLIQVLRKGHEDVKLTSAEMLKLTTWVDANAQFYGTYYGRRHIRFKDHPNFRPVHTFEEATSREAPYMDDPRSLNRR